MSNLKFLWYNHHIMGHEGAPRSLRKETFPRGSLTDQVRPAFVSTLLERQKTSLYKFTDQFEAKFTLGGSAVNITSYQMFADRTGQERYQTISEEKTHREGLTQGWGTIVVTFEYGNNGQPQMDGQGRELAQSIYTFFTPRERTFPLGIMELATLFGKSFTEMRDYLLKTKYKGEAITTAEQLQASLGTKIDLDEPGVVVSTDLADGEEQNELLEHRTAANSYHFDRLEELYQELTKQK